MGQRCVDKPECTEDMVGVQPMVSSAEESSQSGTKCDTFFRHLIITQ